MIRFVQFLENGSKLEAIYISILKKAYKEDIEKKDNLKQKIVEKYTNKFYKNCLLTQRRF